VAEKFDAILNEADILTLTCCEGHPGSIKRHPKRVFFEAVSVFLKRFQGKFCNGLLGFKEFGKNLGLVQLKDGRPDWGLAILCLLRD
jgi:hypothetical protein